jgi:hypothetical protein
LCIRIHARQKKTRHCFKRKTLEKWRVWSLNDPLYHYQYALKIPWRVTDHGFVEDGMTEWQI